MRWVRCLSQSVQVMARINYNTVMRKIRILNNEFDNKKYNEIAIHPLQTWEWGDARKKMGTMVVRMGVFDKDILIEIYQMTIHPLALGFKIGYVPRSLFPPQDVLDFLSIYGQKNNLIFIKIEPYAEAHFKFKISNLKLIKSPHPLFPDWTQNLDLSQSEEDLLKKMRPKTRYNIRLAQKKGVEVKEMSNKQGFQIFQKLYLDTCRRQKYYGHAKKYHEVIWDSLREGIAHILIAFYGDTPLAAYELFKFKDVLYYPYGGTSELHRNLMAANLLMWEAIRLGKKLGATKFDMWGSLPPKYDQRNTWAGFTRFKEGYGTKFTEMVHGLDLVISSPLYSLYNLMHILRSFCLRLGQIV